MPGPTMPDPRSGPAPRTDAAVDRAAGAAAALDRLPLYGLDIETDTTTDGLDPARSAVVAAAVWGGALATDEPVAVVLERAPEEEADLLTRLDAELAALEPGVLVTWNGRRFDLPFIAERSRRLGLRTGLHIDPGTGEAAWYHHRHLDGLRAYRADVGRTLGISCALKALSRFVGEDPVEVDRALIHHLDADVLRDYVLSDAQLARTLVTRRWPAVAAWVDRVPTAT